MRRNPFDGHRATEGPHPPLGALLPPESPGRARLHRPKPQWASAEQTAGESRARLQVSAETLEAFGDASRTVAVGLRKGTVYAKSLLGTWVRTIGALWSRPGKIGKILAILLAGMGIGGLAFFAYILVLALPFLLLAALVVGLLGYAQRGR